MSLFNAVIIITPKKNFYFIIYYYSYARSISFHYFFLWQIIYIYIYIIADIIITITYKNVLRMNHIFCFFSYYIKQIWKYKNDFRKEKKKNLFFFFTPNF